MTNKKLLSLILALAWPTMLEQLMQTLVQYIDLWMVSSLGTEATAAVGATTTVNWLINSSIAALGVGFLAYIAKAIGAGEEEKARRASAQAVLVTLIVGTFFTVITLFLSGFVPVWMQVDEHIRPIAGAYFFILYLPMLPRAATTVFGTVLRAAGDTKTPMRVGLAVNVINVILNVLLIYPQRNIYLFGFSFNMWGMGLGVKGAAAASAIAFLAGGILITRSLFRHRLISPKGQRLTPDKDILFPCLKVALPNMLQRFGTSLGYVAFAAMINSLGEISTAAHTVANTVESAFYIPGYGMQAAAATLAGNTLGECNKEKFRSISRLLMVTEVLLMVLSGALLFMLAPCMMGLFTADARVAHLGITILRMVALSEPFFGIFIIIEGMLQGLGRTGVPFLLNIIGMWLVRIAGTYICTQMLSLGLESAWMCMIAHNLLLCILFIIYWLKNRHKFVQKACK